MTCDGIKAGSWINVYDLRPGDVYSHCGPAGNAAIEKRIVRSIPQAARSNRYSFETIGYSMEYANVANPTVRGGVDEVHEFFSDNSYTPRVFLWTRLAVQEDIDRLEEELALLRENLAKQQAAEVEARISRATASINSQYGYKLTMSRLSAERLERDGLLAK